MIRFAITLDGKRIYVDDAESREAYYCEECNARLIPKKGEFKRHHFAHKLAENASFEQRMCSERDSSNEMTEWHKAMQDRFPLETQERIIRNADGQYCKADVFLEDKKTVIEFQHSKLSYSDFQRRNDFYNRLGLKVIWLFDFDAYMEGKVKWVHPNYYDEFMERQVAYAKSRWNEKQDVYKIDKHTYISTFGRWKVQVNRNVEVHFVQVKNPYTFYKEIKLVAGDFEDGYHSTMTMFTVRSKMF